MSNLSSPSTKIRNFGKRSLEWEIYVPLLFFFWYVLQAPPPQGMDEWEKIVITSLLSLSIGYFLSWLTHYRDYHQKIRITWRPSFADEISSGIMVTAVMIKGNKPLSFRKGFNYFYENVQGWSDSSEAFVISDSGQESTFPINPMLPNFPGITRNPGKFVGVGFITTRGKYCYSSDVPKKYKIGWFKRWKINRKKPQAPYVEMISPKR